MGVVHLFATRSQDDQNAIVTAHELLHTFGATDKYAGSGAPLFPVGYAEPERVPRYPQRYAEIMAGRVPLAPDAPGYARRLVADARRPADRP